jgi:hypothetical protein
MLSIGHGFNPDSEYHEFNPLNMSENFSPGVERSVKATFYVGAAAALTPVAIEGGPLIAGGFRTAASASEALAARAFTTPYGKAIFWGSGPIAKGYATMSAKLTGMYTIAMTPGGRALSLTGFLPRPITRPFWTWACRAYARQASGPVHIIWENSFPKSQLLLTEIPTLKENPAAFLKYYYLP